MKKIYGHMCIPLLMFLSCLNIHGLDSQLFITIEASKVGNLYYEIIENDKRIVDPISYSIFNSHHELIVETNIDNGLLIYNDLPFGNYTIKIKNKEFNICINPEYLKTQHLLKQLDISNLVYTSTNDNNKIYNYIYVNVIGALCVMRILSIKKITLR